ncbi:MAG TPA: peptidylprolyl isomerase [Polyangiaceae bacterium]|nr:peptidylprolyl isomerase [Polyangiaceae bacterium]
MRTYSTAAILMTVLGLSACGDSGTTASGTTSSAGGAGGAGAGGAGGGGGGAIDACGDTDLAEEDLGTGSDPLAGVFSLDDALAGLPEGDGPLRAHIETELGAITCVLRPDVAPNGVANFVGLARGRRPFKDPVSKHWIKGRRFYDGLLFHRVIDDFVAQGGDPLGTGYGGPGYELDDEIGDLSHVPGTLAYANSGPNTNGSQFYVVAEKPATFLDGSYVIFGRCSMGELAKVVDRAQPASVVQAITEVPTDADDAPVDPIHMLHVGITRCAW